MRSRGSKLPKYVYVQHIGGRTYYRFRRGGNTVRLPGTPDTAEFHAAYARLITVPDVRDDRYAEGSVAHTIDLYTKSAEFAELALGTQRDYRRYLDRLDNSVGHRQLGAVNTDYLHLIRDKLKATPVAANHTIAVISALFKFAITRRIVKINPATGIARLKGGDGFERWASEDIEAFRASAIPSMRLALELGLYTGQRLSDVIALRWDSYEGERLRIRQQKTGARLSIPVHEDLRAILAATPRRGDTILTSKTGLPFHSRVFSRDFRAARIAAGLPDGLSFHGLRHTAAAVLAELGAGAPEIMAITGHKSLRLVEHYIRQASQELQADRAISRLPRGPKVLISSAKTPAKH